MLVQKESSMYHALCSISSSWHKEGKNDMYYYMSKVTNWYGKKSTKVKDVDLDIAMWHSKQKLQAPTHALKIKGFNKRSTIKAFVKSNSPPQKRSAQPSVYRYYVRRFTYKVHV